MDKVNEISLADLNDDCRINGFNYVVTKGILNFGHVDTIVQLVRSFNAFDELNDPYVEHDFGSFSFQGEDVFWKIDYYDHELKYGKNPLDHQCNRVLTVLLASEY
jgi:hypothetical protein